MKTIVLAADHNGVELKKILYHHLKSNNYRCIDLGPDKSVSVDYTDYAYQLGNIIDKKNLKNNFYEQLEKFKNKIEEI